MKREKSKLIMNIIIYIVLLLVLYFILRNNIFFKSFNKIIFLLYIALSLIIIYYFLHRLWYEFSTDIYIIYVFSYLVVLIISLYYRKTNDTFKQANPDYIKEWIYILFTNKIVFLNVIGNIILFIPLGFLLSELVRFNIIWKLLFSLVIIVLLELFQYLTKKGVFDYIDIIFNYGGTLIGLCTPRRKKGTFNG